MSQHMMAIIYLLLTENELMYNIAMATIQPFRLDLRQKMFLGVLNVCAPGFNSLNQSEEQNYLTLGKM